MIEVSKVHYDVIAITEKKVQLNITQAVEGLGWEEEEDELAMKITFELYNANRVRGGNKSVLGQWQGHCGNGKCNRV